jgi:hypothetical protein
MMATFYKLIAIRYRNLVTGDVHRSEFRANLEGQKEAKEFIKQKEHEGFMILSGVNNVVKIEHGGGQVNSNREISNPIPKLQGYWISKSDRCTTVCVERVYKKGHVTGFKYQDEMGYTVHSQLKITWKELLEQYERKTN